MEDRTHGSAVGKSMTRVVGALLVCLALVACGGKNKGGKTTPANGSGSGSNTQSMNDTGEPQGGGTGGGSGSAANPAGGGSGSGANPSGGGGADNGPPVVPINLDPDPAAAKTQVEAHLVIARNALAQGTPDAETALREARAALAIDAANIDAAAMVAFAYYHKKLYDTAELVLDDVFRREAAKSNANVMYVYGLVYDKTNRPDRALLAFKKAVELKPDFASALVDLGTYQLKNAQYGDAEQTYEQLTQKLNRNDAITLTNLGSSYRGRSVDFPAGGQRDGYVQKAEGAYKRAIQVNGNYGPAYYNLGLLYLDNDPYPGMPDPMQRINTAKSYFDQYKNMPGFDVKLYDTRMKDVNKALKRAQKAQKKTASGGNP
jgi:tetratricopeptide (TPR) repeat protein